MKTHRFFIKKIEEGPEINITDPDVLHQMHHVLRLKKGDPVDIFDGQGKHISGRIKEVLKKYSIISAESLKFSSTGYTHKIHIAPALIKKDKFEWVVQKCTEIGVESFSPIISERTEKMKINEDRLQKIIIEACEQSGKVLIPKLYEPTNIEDFLKQNQKNLFALDFCETLIDVSQIKSLHEATFLIGPEGGWGESDQVLFEKYNVKKISLGNSILRAETASIAIASIVLLP
jgi:16S rRNA (uracil1498-N3)-methyltransferase